MAWAEKPANELQLFRGSKPKVDVFTKDLMSGSGCCPDGVNVDYDKLGRRVRFDNGLSHLNPLGGNETFHLPEGDGFSSSRNTVVDFINTHGVGARLAIIAIPTYAYVTGVAIKVTAEEPGLTFNLVTRNGLILPSSGTSAGGPMTQVIVTGDTCAPTRTEAQGSFLGFGGLGGALQRNIFARDSIGTFALESDEIIVEVASMPATPVTGAFAFSVGVSYELIMRADI